MFLTDLVRLSDKGHCESLSKLRGLATTVSFRAKLDRSRRIVSRWLLQSRYPVMSCGGGKDSTATLLLVHGEDPMVPVLCADPPNPLPDRDAHIAALERADNGRWIHVAYSWDVEAYGRGDVPHPGRLKIRRLSERFAAERFDGLAMGLRSAESRARWSLIATRGQIYQTAERLTCLPVADWSAAEVLGWLLLLDDFVPLNPVYRKLRLAPPLDYLHDGTWRAPPVARHKGYLEWVRLHYPEVIDRATAVARRDDAEGR